MVATAFSQTQNTITIIDNFAEFSDTAAVYINKEKCDSINKSGPGINKLQDILCINYKINSSGTETVRIEEKKTDPSGCTTHYVYYYKNSSLIKVIAKEGKSVDSIIYYNNNEPIKSIQNKIELFKIYPIQRAYELLHFVNN